MDIITGIILFVVALLIVVLIATYNSIVSKKNAVAQSWSDVHAWVRNAVKILPQLEEESSKYRKYEQEVLAKITELRTTAAKLNADAADSKQLEAVMGQIGALSAGIKVAVEAYPELRSAEVTQLYMREVAENEKNVTAAISVLNSNIARFNDAIQSFPGNFINHVFKGEVTMKTYEAPEMNGQIDFKPSHVA